jgi:hypothetical protein
MKFPIEHFYNPRYDSLSKGRYRYEHAIDSVIYYILHYQYKYDETRYKLHFYE